MTKLAVENLNLSFGEKAVLKNVSLPVPERTITALIGPSGCGKSTLLRSLNRMHDLNPLARLQGRILLDGDDIQQRDAVRVRQRIGMVFQQPNPFPKSIYDNVAYGLRINRMAHRHDLPALVEQSLRASYLWDEVKDNLLRPAFSLSGGQQQRLCIARAIAVRPDVILMDEPCSALDPISTAKVEELMLQLKQHYTLIVVTHNLQQARRVADSTAMMYLGELVEHGPTEQVFDAPRHELTRNYVQGHFG